MKKKVLDVLVDLRKAKALTQQDVAKFFGLQNYNTVSQWENGVATPPTTRRIKFIGYLWYQLGLKDDKERFSQVWNDVMESIWGWEPLSLAEKKQIGLTEELPAQAVSQLFRVPDKVPYGLFGRDELLQELKIRLFTHSQIALYGIAGIGKTALALALAYDKHVQGHFRDGIVWITLGQRADVLAELHRLGAIFDVTLRTPPESSDIHAWVQAIAAAVANRSLLFMIDDAWQSEDALAFRFGGQNCAYLVTTRNPDIAVHFAPSHVFEIPELSASDGLALLSHIAPLVVKRYTTFAKALVTTVGALPMALVLVGNYLRIQSLQYPDAQLPESIFQRLDQAQELLSVAQPQVPIDKHPSLPKDAKISVQALIRISDEALTPAAQSLLRILSIFPAKPNTFSEAAALAVSMSEVTSLQQLREYGLLTHVGTDRYMIHQLIHDYADIHPNYPFITDRLIAYFVAFTTSHQTEYALLDQEYQNILAAIESASQLEMHSVLLAMTRALSEYLELRGFYSLATVQLNRALHAAKSLKSVSGEIHILNALGRITRHLGDYKMAETYFQTGLTLAQACDDVAAMCDFYRNLGSIAYFQGNFQQAEDYWQTGLPIANTLQDRNNMSGFYCNLGVLAYTRNDFSVAEANYQHGLAIAKEIGNIERITGILQNLANIAKRLDEYQKAEAYCQEGLLLATTANLPERKCQMLLGLSGALVPRGAYKQARAYVQEGMQLAQDLKHKEAQCNALHFMGFIARQQNDVVGAMQYYQEGLALAEEIGHPELLGMALYLISGLEVHTGRYGEAAAHIATGLNVATQRNFPFIWVNLHTILGDVHVAQQEFTQAQQAYHAAYTVAQEGGYTHLAAMALSGLSHVAYANNNPEDACQLGREALRIFKRIDHVLKDDTAQWLSSIGCAE